MYIRSKSTIKALSLVLCLVLLLSLAACGGGSKSSDKVLATVGSTDINESLVVELSKLLSFLNGQDYSTLTADQQTQVKNTVTIFCVENTVVKDAMKGDNVITTDIKSNIDSQIKSANEDATFKSQMKTMGITDATIRYYLESQYYSNAFYTKVTTKDEPVTDKEIQDYYDANKASFVSPASITVSHILVSDAAITADGRAKAEMIRKKALNGDDFTKLVDQYSDDPSKATNKGDIGVVTSGAMLVQPFIDASLKLKKKGDISPVTETTYGYHIIMATSDLIPAKQMTLAQSKSQIEAIIGQQHFSDYLKKLKKDAKIKYNVPVDATTGEPSTTGGNGTANSGN